MKIERHIFGSRKGYTTLAATTGLSAQDYQLLEGGAYGFGQTDVPEYLNSLGKSPAFFTRALPGARRALTRVLAGKPDDNGRPTLLMVTAVLSERDWNGSLRGDVATLLSDAKLWLPSTQSEPFEITPAAPNLIIQPHDAAIALAILSTVEEGRPVVGRHGDVTFEAIRALEILMPTAQRPRFTTGWRTLSRNLDATVNVLATEATGADLAQPVDVDTPRSRYATALSYEGTDRGDLSTLLPARYKWFGQNPPDQRATPEADLYVPPPRPKRRTWWQRYGKLAMIAAWVMVALGGTVALLYVKKHRVAVDAQATTFPATTRVTTMESATQPGTTPATVAISQPPIVAQSPATSQEPVEQSLPAPAPMPAVPNVQQSQSATPPSQSVSTPDKSGPPMTPQEIQTRPTQDTKNSTVQSKVEPAAISEKAKVAESKGDISPGADTAGLSSGANDKLDSVGLKQGANNATGTGSLQSSEEDDSQVIEKYNRSAPKSKESTSQAVTTGPSTGPVSAPETKPKP